MQVPTIFRGLFMALIALVAVGVHDARADGGSIVLTVYKAGWIIGGSGGHGTLTFRGKHYSFSVGGIDYGLVFGGSKTVLRGRVKNISRASDVAGVWRGGAGCPAAGTRHRARKQKGRCWSLSAGRSG